MTPIYTLFYLPPSDVIGFPLAIAVSETQAKSVELAMDFIRTKKMVSLYSDAKPVDPKAEFICVRSMMNDFIEELYSEEAAIEWFLTAKQLEEKY
jgi:hypothetical protein